METNSNPAGKNQTEFPACATSRAIRFSLLLERRRAARFWELHTAYNTVTTAEKSGSRTGGSLREVQTSLALT